MNTKLIKAKCPPHIDDGTTRLWVWRGKIYSSAQMQTMGVHRLRGRDVGSFNPDVWPDEERAQKWVAETKPEAQIIAANIRRAIDKGLHSRYGLKRKEIDRLKTGETVEFCDSVGNFLAGYKKI